MPFAEPWRSSFSRGDLVFGYASGITKFISDHKAEGVDDNAKINAYSTDIEDSKRVARYARGAENFVESLARHPKYGIVVSEDENGGKMSALYMSNKASGIKNMNRDWRLKSKGALYWATKEAGVYIHFVLDGIPMNDVVMKNHVSPVAHAADSPQGKATPQDEATKTRTVTHAELRWIYRNRKDAGVMEHIQFWLDNTPCPPPWDTDSVTWAHYVPTNGS